MPKESPAASKAGPEAPAEDSSPFTLAQPPSILQEGLLLGTVLVAQLLARAGLSQGIAPINYIGSTFGVTSTSATLWFPSAFSLTAGTFILVAGRVGDIVGHKSLFLWGIGWYALWSLLAGLAAVSQHPSVVFFDVCRAMQGVAAAVLTPTGLAVIGSVYKPGTRKAKVFAIFAAAAPNGFMLGALFSSLFAQEAWWPWAYWVLALICTALLPAAWLFLPDTSSYTGGGGAAPALGSGRTFDWWGSITGVAGLSLVNVAWNQAPFAGWGTPYVIALLVAGVMLVAAFVAVERRASEPLVPIGAMSIEALYILGCVALGWASFGVWVYYFWEFITRLRGATPLLCTAQILPGSAVGVVAALLTGFLLSRVRKAVIMVAAMLAFAVGSILAATMPVRQNYWDQAFWSVLIIPMGLDLSFPTATLLMSNLVPRSHQGVAASTVAATVNYSISIGLGIAGTVEAQVAHGDLLTGFRGGWYAGIGMSGLSVCLAIAHCITDAIKQRRMAQISSHV